MTESEPPFPIEITNTLAPFDGPFDAFRLPAEGCDVLFASYPAGTTIDDHDHETDNVGVITRGELILRISETGAESRYRAGEWYRVPRGVVHAARFEVDTAEIELWFA